MHGGEIDVDRYGEPWWKGQLEKQTTAATRKGPLQGAKQTRQAEIKSSLSQTYLNSNISPAGNRRPERTNMPHNRSTVPNADMCSNASAQRSTYRSPYVDVKTRDMHTWLTFPSYHSAPLEPARPAQDSSLCQAQHPRLDRHAQDSHSR